MNGPLFDDLVNQFKGDPARQLGQSLGLSPDAALQAVTAALPLLIGGLQRNAQDPGGAQSLFGALAQDHRGIDPGNALGSALAGGSQGDGILGHVFGTRRPVAEQALGSFAGLGQDRAGTLLRVLAPIVMAYLARRVFASRAADGATTPTATPDGVRTALDTEAAEIRSRGGPGSGLMSLLDRDQDGDVDLSDFIGSGIGTPSAEMRSPRSSI